jgi:hypothetical protein
MSDIRDNVPQELDWVDARAACSIGVMFKTLELGVHQDVERRVALLKPEEQKMFRVISKARRFSVVCESNEYETRSVDFSCTDREIAVSSGGETKFTATISLTNSGQCKFVVNEQEVEQWQLRRMALEDLFFGTGKSLWR